MADKNVADKELAIIFRAYDEGLAFRYRFSKQGFKDLVLRKESTSFSFDNDYTAWVTDSAQGFYVKTRIDKIKGLTERPLVIMKNDLLI